MQMVRVRNPWGNECEWKGAWSDKWVELDIDLLIASCHCRGDGIENITCCFCRSQEWKLISEQQRQEMGLTFDNDGEFW